MITWRCQRSSLSSRCPWCHRQCQPLPTLCSTSITCSRNGHSVPAGIWQPTSLLSHLAEGCGTLLKGQTDRQTGRQAGQPTRLQLSPVQVSQPEQHIGHEEPPSVSQHLPDPVETPNSLPRGCPAPPAAPPSQTCPSPVLAQVLFSRQNHPKMRSSSGCRSGDGRGRRRMKGGREGGRKAPCSSHPLPGIIPILPRARTARPCCPTELLPLNYCPH